MKQASLLVLAVVLGLGQGCASSTGGGAPGEFEDAEGPQMRLPSPEAAVFVPGEGADMGAASDEQKMNDGASDDLGYRFKPGDGVVINISGISPPQSVEDIVDEKGYISLPYIGPLKAQDVTASELEEMVHAAYVPNFYRYATVSVFVPARGYYMRGEVRQPGRFPLVPGMTILQAVATAGGYTEFASPRRVRILRDGKTIKINLNDLDKNPEKDIPIEARDVIVVPREWW